MSVALNLEQLSEKMQPCSQFRLAALFRKNYFYSFIQKLYDLKYVTMAAPRVIV